MVHVCRNAIAYGGEILVKGCPIFAKMGRTENTEIRLIVFFCNGSSHMP